MITARLLGLLAAFSLAGIAHAQSQTPPAAQPGTAPPATAPVPSSASRMRANQAPTNANPPRTAGAPAHRSRSLRVAEAVGRAWGNMAVQTPSGQSLGAVSKVVPGLNGRQSSGYVVVSDSNGMSTPVPYRTANSMVRNGKLVCGQSRFRHAPTVTQQDLENSSDRAWRVKADRYWTHKAHTRPRK